MKVFHNIYLAFLILIFSVIIFSFSLFQYEIGKVSNKDELKEVVIEPGGIDSIATTLYENHLIKNKLAFKIYVHISGKKNLKAATYSLSENMGVKKIVEILHSGSGTNSNQLCITFQEGLNMRAIAKIIEKNTNNTEDQVYETLSNTNYLNSLIENYWFLGSDILNTNIYYSLEGYLYPSTYCFTSQDVTISKILETMLSETEKQIASNKEQIQNSTMTPHEIFTLASIVELEGVTSEDRKGITSVFLNRLKKGMNLGSDVTTYYGAKIDMGERDLYAAEVSECNYYNTRCSNYKNLPISPICNPSIDSIVAVLEPIESDNYYFVADKNKKVYFSKSIKEHNDVIAKLKKEGLWYEY